MSENTTLGLPEAARRLGVPVRVLRQAIREGKVAAPAHLSATVVVSEAWLSGVETAVEADPALLRPGRSRKVPEFARYPGTSAWRKYRHCVRQYASFLAAHPTA